MSQIRRVSTATVLKATSPDGRWQIELDDSSPEGNGGSRSSGNGSVTLFNTELHQPVFEWHEIARPMDGDVSNTGRFVVLDAGWRSSGRMIVFDRNGQILYERQFTANILTVSISPSGRYVLSQTLYAEGSQDCQVLEVADLETGEVPIRTTPMTANPASYVIEETDDDIISRVIASIPSMGDFAYSAEGIFVDAYLYRIAQVDGDNLYEAVLAMEALMKQSDVNVANKIIASAPNVAERLLSVNPRWAAKALRFLGESFELRERLGDAVYAYHQALALDPTVGVKRRLERIQNK